MSDSLQKTWSNRHIFLGHNLLASDVIPPKRTEYGTQFFPQSELFICPKCGETWGRIIVEKASAFIPVMLQCRTHNGGSFLLDIHSADWQFLPRKLLSYEVLLLKD